MQWQVAMFLNVGTEAASSWGQLRGEDDKAGEKICKSIVKEEMSLHTM